MSENIDQVNLLREMNIWLRLLGMRQLVETINSILNDSKKISAYQHSDGERTTREIESLTGFNKDAVSDLWKKCALGGLGEYKTASGGRRFKKTFDLEALGLIQSQKKTVQSNSNSAGEVAKMSNVEEVKTDE